MPVEAWVICFLSTELYAALYTTDFKQFKIRGVQIWYQVDSWFSILLATGRIGLCSSVDPKVIRPLKTILEHFSFEVWTVRSASNHATKWSSSKKSWSSDVSVVCYQFTGSIAIPTHRVTNFKTISCQQKKPKKNPASMKQFKVYHKHIWDIK